MTSNEQRGLDAAAGEWVLVPKQPTAEMIKAGELWSGLPSQTWQDMLDAAPLPSQVAPNADLVGLMAHQITGAINGNCCHSTGGLVDIHTCECRDAADRLLEAFPGIAAVISATPEKQL